VVLAVVAFTEVVPLAALPRVTGVVLLLASIAYFATMLSSPKVMPEERTKVRAYIPLFIANAAFWSLFQQIFTVLAVYSDERMNWSIGGWTAPSSWVGSLEPIWIIILSPVFAAMWTSLDRAAPSTPRKFSYGVMGMGVAFLAFLIFASGTGRSTPAIAVFVILGMFAVSELMISPIGLSVTTKLAPEAFRAQMMALYFFSVGLGTSMSGVLAQFYSVDSEFSYFGVNGIVVIVVGVVLFALSPWISRHMEGEH
jgi:POT family proton-dependent oligopeptide transporter